MKPTSTKLALSISLLAAAGPQFASADFDQWRINEIFSSADGSIQYLELTTSAANQQDLSGRSLLATNTITQAQNSLQFTTNLVGTTTNKSLLLATAGFASLTGLTPDITIAAGFLPTSGGTLNFAAGTSTLSYQASQIPLNGEQSLSANLQPIVASPTNFAGLSASVVAPVYAAFDGANSTLNLPVVDVPGVGVANISFDVNLQSLQFALRNDFYLYGGGIVAGSNAAQLQSGNVLFIPALPIGVELYAFKLALVGDNPITFGNLFDIVVTNTVPEPEPEPEPEPQPSELQQSITRGQSEFALRCSVCHGANGEGGSAPDLRGSALDSFNPLRSYIDLNMPQGNASSCRDNANSSCATDTANYIINVFQLGQSSLDGPPDPDPGNAY